MAWYLPGHVNPALDLRRSLAMLRFTDSVGQGFDGIGLDVEATKLRNVEAPLAARRDARARGARRRQARPRSRSSPSTRAGSSGTSRSGRGSPGRSSPRRADAFAPMVYTGGAFKGFDATYGYVTRALRLLRTQTRDPDVAIHVAGGVADRLGAEELAGFSPRWRTTAARSASASTTGRRRRAGCGPCSAHSATDESSHEANGPPDGGPFATSVRVRVCTRVID